MPRRKVLLVAYHFPPIQGSTGTLRTVAFSRYLRQYGWDVCILTITAMAYEATAAENESLVPDHVRVERAWGLDAKRHLSIRGKYPRAFALPDPWQSWIIGSYLKGARILKSWQADVIMTTYPIPSTHVIGYLLQRKFRLPWVAEFRDPMLQPTFPRNRWERCVFARIEQAAFSHAAEIVVTTMGCKRMYAERFPGTNGDKITVVSNGYDPVAFSKIRASPREEPNHFVMLHSGLLYPHERDPTAFFRAVQSISRRGLFDHIQVEFRFRASGNDKNYIDAVEKLGIAPWVRILPRLPYANALQEMISADGLMLFQAKTCNDQIPAKAYEYLYCRKPVLAFTDRHGDTAKLLESVGIRSIADLGDSADIEVVLERFLEELTLGTAFVVAEHDSRRYSREALTGELSQVLERAIASHKLCQ